MVANSFSTRVKSTRMAAGLQGKDLAARLGISRPYMTQIEKGQREPSSDLLTRLAKELQVSTQWLLEGAHSDQPKLVERNENEEPVEAQKNADHKRRYANCKQCSEKDSEIIWLREQLSKAQDNLAAALAVKPSPAAEPACGAAGGGRKERMDA